MRTTLPAIALSALLLCGACSDAPDATPSSVTLAELKARPSLRDFPLVRLPRLSAMPVNPAEWKEIERLSRA